MKTPHKVSTIPIQQLWREAAWIDATRDRFLTPEETKEFIKNETVSIAIASMMAPMYWPSRSDRFNDWKSIKPLLLDGTQDEWVTDKHQFYVASLWHSDSGDYLLFEHHH
jgi:hypothetical protein